MLGNEYVVVRKEVPHVFHLIEMRAVNKYRQWVRKSRSASFTEFLGKDLPIKLLEVSQSWALDSVCGLEISSLFVNVTFVS